MKTLLLLAFLVIVAVGCTGDPVTNGEAPIAQPTPMEDYKLYVSRLVRLYEERRTLDDGEWPTGNGIATTTDGIDPIPLTIQSLYLNARVIFDSEQDAMDRVAMEVRTSSNGYHGTDADMLRYIDEALQEIGGREIQVEVRTRPDGSHWIAYGTGIIRSRD